ncbi:MAG: hypothetical protein A2176_07515 [Spirochaetes bacterium RBG_13_51_14]|nr:MAG: hypothetical protein A2176_07515 [Spirochaetes bacterium RBG_13_51_14]
MGDPVKLNIPRSLEEIGEAVLASLAYKRYPRDKLDRVMKTVDYIMSHPANRKECENHLKSSGSNYVLFFISNILYNLKQRGQLILTDDVMKWLGSVWNNFLKRNKLYQDLFPRIDEYRIKLRKYYPGVGTFINQIENVNLIKEDFVIDVELEESPIRKLERFHQSAQEVLNAMKPSYFFLLDYYYEKKMATGADSNDAVAIEAGGLVKFGQLNYTYAELAILTCQALGILEAAYLILKKRKSHRRLISVNGKQKFLTTPEIYNMYLEKFNAMKKELTNINK